MKIKILPYFLILFFYFNQSSNIFANEPDSAWLFSYASKTNEGRNGLHFAYSIDKKNWISIGNEFGFLKSDYGAWGSEKKMQTPFLLKGADGIWHCIWSLNDKDNTFSHAASKDLVNWGRQSYPAIPEGNCLNPEIRYESDKDRYIVCWENTKVNKVFGFETKDFKSYKSVNSRLNSSDAQKKTDMSDLIISVLEPKNYRQAINILHKEETGQIHRVSWSQIENLRKTVDHKRYRSELADEKTIEDPIRFANLKPLDAKLVINANSSKTISDLLVGIFFEDINYAADGGLYAELIQNRDFEYSLSDKSGRDKTWNSFHSWALIGSDGKFTIDTLNPIHKNNPHYAILEVFKKGTGIVNTGFDGIKIKKDEKYDFSIFAKQLQGKGGKLEIRLVNNNSEIIAQTTITGISKNWKKLNIVLKANADASEAKLVILPLSDGKFAMDMVSLFPQNTFMGRKNGLRKDLAQTIADIKPRFVRFPGGCVAHGDGLDNIYRWKNTVGPLEERVPLRNIWNYHQTAGLGYFEYFQYCEDIGAQPLPVLAAGVPCQNSATGGAGQQGGIPICEMDEYIQEILDLIEWANGDAKTTKWGKVRAQAGHPKPFNLKYVGIGNEDLITDVFEERFTMIFKAIKEKHPEITVIGTVGPFFEGADYVEGWKIATNLKVPMVDEHYYQTPGWFINNQDFYDNYDRTKSKVYLGEYAAHLPGRPNNLETALAEAIYLTSLERNGDIVSMTSYAPLLAKDGHTQWNPDLIYFNNQEVKPTVGYYVQKLYGENSGNKYIENSLIVNTRDEKDDKRVACSVVTDDKTGDLIVKLVNLLPVNVKTQIILDSYIAASKATKTVLSGKPDNRKLLPSSEIIEISPEFGCDLPAYSFTVIRIKPESQKNGN